MEDSSKNNKSDAKATDKKYIKKAKTNELIIEPPKDYPIQAKKKGNFFFFFFLFFYFFFFLNFIIIINSKFDSNNNNIIIIIVLNLIK